MNIRSIIEYFNNVIGIEIDITPLHKDLLSMLNYRLRGSFNFNTLRIEKHEFVLISEKDAHLTPYETYIQVEELKKILNREIIITMNKMLSYDRIRLIKYKVGFIVPKRHLYIPNMFIDLRENYSIENNYKDTLKPATQFILLFHLLRYSIDNKAAGEILDIINKAAIPGGGSPSYSLMTVSRAIKELNHFGICQRGRSKKEYLIFPQNKIKLLQKALPFMMNPVKKKIKIFESPDKLPHKRISGISALASYSDIASDNSTETYAVFYKNRKSRALIDKNSYDISRGNFDLQLWSYCPEPLSQDGKNVDPISLYLTLKDSADERVQKAIEDMIRNII